MKNYFLLISLFLCLSCKDTSSTIDPQDDLTLLTSGVSKKWKVTDGIIILGETSINLLANQPPCVSDNIIVLNKDKTYELLEGATKCDASKDPDVILKANWNYVENPKTLSIDKLIFLGYTIEKPVFKITDISTDAFKGTADIKLNGKDYVANVTFSAVK